MNISNIQKSVQLLEENTNSLKGKVSILEEQFIASSEKFDELKELQDVNSKAVELLNLVQKATRDLIKDIFENIVTKALQYIHQSDDYKFELEFSRHGNTPKLRFLIKTPDMQDSHDLMTTRAGGSKDIVALALRFVLMEISRNTGFLFCDEPFKRLDNNETIQKAIEFIKETQASTDRQIFIITHKDEVINSVSNPIIIEHKKPIKVEEIKKPKKKRGRPKKENKSNE